MGKSSRAYCFREIKGQRAEKLASAAPGSRLEQREAARQAALARAAAAPKVPVPVRAPRGGGDGMQLDDQAVARGAGGDEEEAGAAPMEDGAGGGGGGGAAPADAGEARLRRVLCAAPAHAFPKFGRQLKSFQKKAGLPVHANTRKLRSLKKALKRGAPLA